MRQFLHWNHPLSLQPWVKNNWKKFLEYRCFTRISNLLLFLQNLYAFQRYSNIFKNCFENYKNIFKNSLDFRQKSCAIDRSRWVHNFFIFQKYRFLIKNQHLKFEFSLKLMNFEKLILHFSLSLTHIHSLNFLGNKHNF